MDNVKAKLNEAHLAQSVERPAFKAGPNDYVNRAAMGSSPIVGVSILHHAVSK